MTLRCPECGDNARVTVTFQLVSTDGPIDHVRIDCVSRHHFLMPTDWLCDQDETD